MKILVVSDTHAKCKRVYDVFKKLNAQSPVDVIVHCGDYYSDALEIQSHLGVKVVWVKGNSDGCFDEDEYAILETEAGDFFIAHGHLQQVGYSQQNIYYQASEKNCIGALYGHTHRASWTDMGGFYLMNPGSLTEPRDGSGGTFGVIWAYDNDVHGKIYKYSDFMNESDNADSSKKPKVRGGHLREMLNYSDGF